MFALAAEPGAGAKTRLTLENRRQVLGPARCCPAGGWRKDPADFGKPEASAEPRLMLPCRGLARTLARHSRVRRLLESRGVCRVNPEAFEYPLGGRIKERR